MTAERSPVGSVNEQLVSVAELSHALAHSTEQLRLAVGELVGSQVLVEGRPSWVKFNQTPDPGSGRPRSAYGPLSEREPLRCLGEVKEACHGFIEVALVSPSTAVGDFTAYSFRLANLVSITPVESASE